MAAGGQKQKCFEFCLKVHPVVRRKNVETFANGYAKVLYKKLKNKEKPLEEILVDEDKHYLHIKKVEKVAANERYLKIRCYVVTETELEDLNSALKSGAISKRLTEYGYSIGLGIKFDIKPSDRSAEFELRVSFENQEIYNEGKIHFIPSDTSRKSDTTTNLTAETQHSQRSKNEVQGPVIGCRDRNVKQTGKEGRTQKGEEGETQKGKEGDQQTGNEGEKQTGKEGETQADKEGRTQKGKEGETQKGKEGDQQTGNEGEKQTDKEGETQKGKEGETQKGKEGDQQTGNEGEKQMDKEGETQKGKEGETQKGKEGETQKVKEGDQQTGNERDKQTGKEGEEKQTDKEGGKQTDKEEGIERKNTNAADGRDVTVDQTKIKEEHHEFCLKRTFCVYVPANPKHVKSVTISSKEVDKLNGFPMANRPDGSHIWYAFVTMPLDNEQFTYRFQVNYVTCQRFFYQTIIEEKTVTSEEYFHGETDQQTNHYYILTFYDKKKYVDGYQEICLHILKNVDEVDLKESIMQLESLHKKGILTIDYACKVVENIQQDLKEILNRPKYLAFVAFLCLAFNNLKHILEHNCVKPDILTKVLCALQKSSLEEIPSTCQERFVKVVFLLSQKLTRENFSVFSFMHYAYPFLSPDYFISMLDSNVPLIKDQSSPGTKNMASTVLKFLYLQVCEKDSFLTDQRLLEKIQTNLPLDIFFHAMNELEASNICSTERLQEVFQRSKEKLHYRCKAELHNLSQSSSIDRLLEFWQYVRSHRQIETSQLIPMMEAALLTAISKTDGVEHEKLRTICLDRDLFTEQETQVKLLSGLAESKSVDVHYLLIILLKQEKFSTLDISDVEMLAKTWFDCVMKKHFGDRRKPQADYIPDLYCYLSYLLSVPVIRENEKLTSDIEDMAFQFLQAVNIKDVIKKIKNIEKYSDDIIEDIYRSHVQRLLFQSRDTRTRSKTINSLIQEICGRTCLRVNSGLTLGIVETLLKLTGITSDLPDEDVLLTAVNASKFWEKVFGVVGLKQSTVKAHPSYIKVDKAIDQMVQQLNSDRIECKLLKIMENKTEDLLDILSCKTSRGKMETAFKKAQDYLSSFVRDCKLTISVLHKCRIKLQSGILIESVAVTIEALSSIEDDLYKGSVQLKELKSKSFFDPLLSEMTECCNRLSDITESRVFWNVTKSLLDKISITGDESEESEEEDVLMSVPLLFEPDHEDGDRNNFHEHMKMVSQLLHYLVDKGILAYHTAWEPHTKGEDIGLLVLEKQFQDSSIDKEIKIVKNIYKRLDNKSQGALLMYADFEKHGEKVTAMKKALVACNIDASTDEEFNSALTSFEQLCKSSKTDEESESITLFSIHKALTTVKEVTQKLDEETTDILLGVGESQSLMEFLQEVADDDIRNLIDAVEEHSEQYVQESTVSSLIDVKRVFQPILKKSFSTNLIEFFLAITKSASSSGIKDVPRKIHECMDNLHSLKALYKNVANRGERTKEIVENVVKKGKFHFVLEEQTCHLKVEYKQDKKTVAHTESGLNDLRSRALLIMNTEEKKRSSLAKTEPKDKDFLSPFVQQIDTAFKIAQILKHLQFSGHFSYTIYDKKVAQQELLCLRNKLQAEYDDWCDMLSLCRKRFYFMNFIYSEQLQILYQYFDKGTNRKLVLAVLKYIHPDTETSECDRAFYKSIVSNDMNNPASVLECLGRTIHSILESTTTVEREFRIPKTSKKLGETVQEGKLFVAALEEGSQFIVRTILALYLNTTGHLPEPHQILVCNRHTTWDEILLLLQRCIRAFEYRSTKELFCIANVEMIASELQFMLVDKLRSIPRDLKYYLFLVCRGNERHPFLDQFRECILHPRPLPDAQMKRCFEEQWPSVVTITSDIPGLGKTEYVKQQAFIKSMNVSLLHISGPFEKKPLVERLSNLKFKTSNNILHIDIGMVDSPVELDSFLFELITLGCVTAGTKSFFLPTKNVYIEVANTLNQSLCNSLPTVTSFKRTNLKWEGYKNFKVSMEINSPVQVVCNYLKCMEEGVLNETDLGFVGHNTVKALGREICQKILQRHFSSAGDLSFTLVNIFLNVLSDQLKKLSASVYFRMANLIAMLGEKKNHDVKSNLVKALVDVSKEFSARSIHSCRSTQAATLSSDESKQSISTAAEVLALRVEGMIRWEDSNHLMILFHQDGQTISALYRDKKKVPGHVKHLIESQINRELVDFHLKTQNELQLVLQRLARSQQQPQIADKALKNMTKRYALTSDNLLKMVLIILRIKAHVPVIIMGETGCGKTSLVRYLADMCGVTFKVLSIHAGITEEVIVKNVITTNTEARKSSGAQVWMFLDEINTCDHLGLICDIVCHHRCLGTTLAPNIVFMAACNPYRLRDEESVVTSGLQGKIKSDELSRLVYRVHPLPETMVDFVWDFGSLSEKDEHSYICKMVQDTFEDEKISILLSELLTASQRFVRSTEGTRSCVSLRDVERCKKLVLWFLKTLKKKESLRSNSYFWSVYKTEAEHAVTAIILALALCYHSRFSDTKIRTEYRKVISDIVYKHGGSEYKIYSEKDVAKTIQREQKDIIDRMEVPEGTAKNTALQENVFIILVCILNRIPIFLVGKPGCSKSLSMQLIRSNLRGKDSRDEFFQTLPQLYCVSFQGSESSTSDGIIKVFDKAKKYQEHNEIADVMSVVILDEIGLAEISRFNPLKVLHSLLEPENKPCPDVAVVGLSNWALDAAKMNRAIHLSRPEMDREELYETGISISESIFSKPEKILTLKRTKNEARNLPYEMNMILRALAWAYYDYSISQKFKNFHGLRDYYSLNKHISRTLLAIEMSDDKVVSEVLMRGILRNFGGLPSELKSIVAIFQKHLDRHFVFDIPVLDLIQENLFDRISRHLMLITSGDAVTSKVEQLLRQNEREYMVIYGSQFEEDLTDDYNYRILSRIILCMEQGLVLILKDLESIYGSLYDMLNQNYTVVGQKKNCRVALGPYSNPMCQVHDDFKCIVLVEERKLDYSDPPFLNRFEKQQFWFSDILDKTDSEIINHLGVQIQEFCKIDHFTPSDAFPIYSSDMLASLVLHLKIKINECQTNYKIAELCFKHLLNITTPEAVLRIKKSMMWIENKEFARELQDTYLSQPLHNGFDHYISSQIDQLEKNYLTENVEMLDTQNKQWCHLNALEDKEDSSSSQLQASSDGHESLYVVFTHSNIHIDIKECTGGRNIQIEKVGSFKTEKQLHSRLQFFFESDNDILVIQVSAKDDAAHILLTKSAVETLTLIYQKENHLERPKIVFMVLHLERKDVQLNPITQLNFLSGWKMVTLDSLEKPDIQLPKMIDMTVLEVLKCRRPLYQCIKEQLFWAFTRIHYSSNRRSITNMKNLLYHMQLNDDFLKDIEHVIFAWIENEMEKEMGSLKTIDWQVDIACDAFALGCATTFMDALESYILEMIKHPLAKIIFRLEESNAAECYFIQDSHSEVRREFWRNIVYSSSFLQLHELKQPTGPECYNCTTPTLKMKMPFSQIIITKVEQLKNDFLDTLTKLKSYCDIEDEVPEPMFYDLASKYEDIVMQEVDDLLGQDYECKNEDYIYDYCMFIVSQSASNVEEEIGYTVLKWEFSNHINLSIRNFGELVTHLHTAFWTYSSTMLSMLQLVKQSTVVMGNEVIKMLQSNIGEKTDNVLYWLLEDDVTENTEHETGSETIDTIDMKDPDLFPNEELVTGESKDEGDNSNNGAIGNVASKMAGKNLSITETTQDISVEDIQPEFYDEINSMPEPWTGHADTCEPLTGDPYIYESKTELNPVNAADFISGNFTKSICPEVTDKIFEKNESYPEPETSRDVVSSDENLITNRETLTKYICKHIFPIQRLMNKLSLASWKQILSSMLPLLGNVSVDLEEVYKLRFCNDVANVLIIPYSLPVDILIVFGNSLQHTDLNSKDMFKLLMDQMYTLHEDHLLWGVELQRIINFYIGRCLACDPDSDKIMKNILTYISSRKLVDPKLSFLGPIVRLVIHIGMSEEESNDVLKNLLIHDSIENNLLRDIDNCLIKLNEEGHHSSVFSTLLIDVLESIFIEDLDIEDLRAIESSKDEIIHSALVADEVLHEGCFNLRFVVSVAYLKAFLKKFTSLIGDNLADIEEFTVLCNNINAMLPLKTYAELARDRSKELLIFMLKCFVSGNGNISVVKICKNAAFLLPNVEKIYWNPEFSLSSLEYSPFALHCFRGYLECISILKEHDLEDAAVETFVTNAVVSKTRLFAFMGAVLNRYTIRKTHVAVTDLEKLFSEKLLKVVKAKLENEDQYRLLECATGKIDYGHGIYNFTAEAPENESYVASVLLHLLCILTVYEYKDSVLYKCMTKPSLKQLNATAQQDKVEVSTLAGYLCDCGYRYVSKDNTCPVCSSKGSKKEVLNKTDITSRLSPISRSITQLFVNGCLLNSLSLHHSKIEDLQEILGLETKDDVAVEVQERVFTEWSRLKLLLGVNNKDLCGLCNIVLYRCHSSMANPTENVAELEEELQGIIDETVQEGFSVLKEMRCKVYQASGVSFDAVECDLDEVTELHHGDDDKRLLYQSSFFRITGSPTLENLHAELYTGSNYQSYPFLCLVLQNLQQLSMPQYISPLLRWHLATVSCASYTIRKVECKDVTIGKLINKAGNEKAKSILRKSFKIFEKAWNKLKEEFVDTLKLIQPDMPTLDLVSSGSKVSQCIVMDNSSPLHVVLCTLVQIQNMFLDEALQVVAQKDCPSISFVNANEQSAWISAVPLMNLEDKDVIKYEWTDDILRYSQCATEFGHGKKIQYDFAKIEMELAQEIMFRKPYISLPKAFTQIMFTDELFHNSVSLMKEIRSSIPQEQLTSEIINGIQRKKDKNITESLTLLGMVLTILKKTGGDGSLPLVEFIEHWKDIILQSSFKRLLPEPEHCVKLCHIVALYEWFEEQNGESVFESLDDGFRIPLPNDAKSKLEDNASNNIRLLEKLGHCLKVFVHRCLSSKDSDIEREQPLIDYIRNPAFWQEGTMDGNYIIADIGQEKMKLMDVVSSTLKVEHIYGAISFIQDKIEEHKEKDQRISSIAATYQASKPDMTGKSKRRRTVMKVYGKT